METKTLETYAKNTWCPGCGNFAILNAVKTVLTELAKSERLPFEDVVLVSGVGCHAKIVDYINLNSFYSIHGTIRSNGSMDEVVLSCEKVFGV